MRLPRAHAGCLLGEYDALAARANHCLITVNRKVYEDDDLKYVVQSGAEMTLFSTERIMQLVDHPERPGDNVQLV